MKILIISMLFLISSCSYMNKGRSPASVPSTNNEIKNQHQLQSILKNNGVQIENSKRTLVIEFNFNPGTEELNQVKAIYPKGDLSLFDNFQSDYFKRLYRIDFSANEKMENTIKKEIEKLPFIKLVERDFVAELQSIQIDETVDLIVNDSLSNFQWGLYNNGQKVLKDIDDIHLETLSGKKGVDIGFNQIKDDLPNLLKEDVIIAILDSGLDLKHPDLKDNIAKNMVECSSIGQPHFKPKKDIDENGYLGDCAGWNFTSDKKGGDHKMKDSVGHGTHVAGIIAASINNNLGVAGLSGHLKILPIKVLGGKKSSRGNRAAANPNGPLTTRISKGILYAIKMKAKVINMSLGWPRILDTKFLRESFNEAEKAGITIVAAAGNNNNNSPVFPCAYSNVICVGSISIDGSISNFSNYGGYVDVLAPGDNILSTYPTAKDPQFFSVKGYEIKNGTSQASPYVAAMAGILKSIYPEISNNELTARLLGTAKDVDFFHTHEKKYTSHGLVKLDKAIKIEEVPVIKPSFKDMKSVVISPKSKSFTFEIYIRNFWKKSEEVHVDIEINDPNVQLRKSSFIFDSLEEGEGKPIKVQGRLKDTSKDNNLEIIVHIESKELAKKTYRNEFKVSQLLRDDKRVITHKINDLGQNLKIGVSQRGKIHTYLRTVGNPLFLTDHPQYYLKNIVKKPADDAEATPDVEIIPGVEIIIFTLIENEYRTKTKLVIPGATSQQFIHLMDMNYDGKLDYLVGTIGSKDDKKFLQFSFFDQEGKPLYGERSHWKLNPGPTYIEDFRKISLIPVEVEGLGKVATLAFFNKKDNYIGRVPDEDQNPDPWIDKDYTKGRHFFYFKPVVDGNSISMDTRVMDNFNWTQKVKKKLKLAWNDNISILDILPQSANERKLGVSKGIISVGKNFFTKSYIVDLNLNGTLKYNEIDAKNINLVGSHSLPVINLGEGEMFNSSTAFAGHYDQTTVKITHLNGLHLSGNTNPTPAPKNQFNIISTESKKCLSKDLSTNEIYQFDCVKEGSKAQHWKIIDHGNNLISIKSNDSGKCISVNKKRTWKWWLKDKVFEVACNNANEQKFQKVATGENLFLKSIKSGKCIGLKFKRRSKDRLENYLGIEQKDCKNKEHQKWALKSFNATSVVESFGRGSYNFNHSSIYKESQKRDHILKTLASYKDNSKYYTFLETKSKLKVHIFDKTTNKTEVKSRPITRFSFLPGSIFSETLYPIAMGQGEKRKPALYIDGTQIIRGDIYVLTLQDNGDLISPIKYNINVPSNCKPMNPIPYGKDKIFAFTLFCKELPPTRSGPPGRTTGPRGTTEPNGTTTGPRRTTPPRPSRGASSETDLGYSLKYIKLN